MKGRFRISVVAADLWGVTADVLPMLCYARLRIPGSIGL
ncbi:hypothetical protein MARINOS108_10635 [Marinoscillum sp. 108]|nr:hypothetical protein MARINOS108_10635 [Marinoscillum sp. 108]